MRISVEFHPSGSPTVRSVHTAVDLDTYDGEPGSPCGYGHTREEAVRDLLEQTAEAEREREDRRVRV